MGLTRTIENKWIASRCGWTPFDGMKTKGWAVAAILRGQIVMREFALDRQRQRQADAFCRNAGSAFARRPRP